MTIRPFRWHDWPRFQKLVKDGLNLDVESSLVRGTGTIRDTVLATLPAEMGGMPTFVVQNGEAVAIGQLRHHPGDQHARLASLAPMPDEFNVDLWQEMVESLTYVAGERGAVSVIAEVSEESLAFEVLRKAGFGVYAHQEVWKRLPSPVEKDQPDTVRPAQAEDAWQANMLYTNLVPGLLQQAEPAPDLENGEAYVLDSPDGIRGLIVCLRGTQGTLLQAYLHPDAHHRVDEAVAGTLRYVNAARQPVYFRVRRYQDWFSRSLARHGFESLGQQVVMVKHTATRIQRREEWSLPLIQSGKVRPVPDVFAPPNTSGWLIEWRSKLLDDDPKPDQ